MAGTNISVRDSHLEKTAKLIPAEALALFVPISNTIAASGMSDERKEWFVLGVALFIGFAIVPAILHFVHQVNLKRQYAISVVAFFLWVFNVQYASLPTMWGEHETAIVTGAILMALFTFIAPFFVAGEEKSKDKEH